MYFPIIKKFKDNIKQNQQTKLEQKWKENYQTRKLKPVKRQKAQKKKQHPLSPDALFATSINLMHNCFNERNDITQVPNNRRSSITQSTRITSKPVKLFLTQKKTTKITNERTKGCCYHAKDKALNQGQNVCKGKQEIYLTHP